MLELEGPHMVGVRMVLDDKYFCQTFVRRT